MEYPATIVIENCTVKKGMNAKTHTGWVVLGLTCKHTDDTQARQTTVNPPER